MASSQEPYSAASERSQGSVRRKARPSRSKDRQRGDQPCSSMKVRTAVTMKLTVTSACAHAGNVIVAASRACSEGAGILRMRFRACLEAESIRMLDASRYDGGNESCVECQTPQGGETGSTPTTAETSTATALRRDFAREPGAFGRNGSLFSQNLTGFRKKVVICVWECRFRRKW